MNRELKFRVWDILAEHYTLPSRGFGSEHHVLYLTGKYLNLQNGVSGDEVIVEQFTGLKDSEGIEIYEGDILSDEDEILLIEYCEEFARFGGIIYLEEGEIPENDSWRWGDEIGGFKIIGNVHQNSDLLKGENE